MNDDTLAGRGAPEARSPRPLRLQVLSDLHLDVRAMELPSLSPDVDVVVVAGDVRQGPHLSFEVMRRAFPEPTPIVAVLGNHEFYRSFHPDALAVARSIAPAFGISLLEDAVVEVGGACFVGSTLWTDYRLDGEDSRVAAMTAAAGGVNDHRLIGWSRDARDLFTPERAAALHGASTRFIAEALARPFAGPTVVVTHHAPSPLSVHPRYEGSPYNAAFASDLGDLIEAGAPDLWVHGHVHSSFDYRIGRTRIVCNPRGYGNENPEFDPALVVEIAR